MSKNHSISGIVFKDDSEYVPLNTGASLTGSGNSRGIVNAETNTTT